MELRERLSGKVSKSEGTDKNVHVFSCIVYNDDLTTICFYLTKYVGVLYFVTLLYW